MKNTQKEEIATEVVQFLKAKNISVKEGRKILGFAYKKMTVELKETGGTTNEND